MNGGGAGGGKGAAAEGPVPAASRRLVQSLKEIMNRPEAEIYAALRECGMDPDEAGRLLSQDYDYFEFLTPDMRNNYLQLQGPCYPVIFPSVNVYWSCQLIARPSNVSLKHWQQIGGVYWSKTATFNCQKHILEFLSGSSIGQNMIAS